MQYQSNPSPINVSVNIPSGPQQPTAPSYQLPTNRSMIKLILLGILTLGIYPLCIMTAISGNINTIASKHDGKKTMNFLLLTFIIVPITLGIGAIVWQHKISNRIGGQLRMRGIGYNFSATDFWLWNVLGSLIVVGPFIYLHKFCKSMNLIAADYNQRG